MKSGDEGKTWSGVKRKSFLSFLLNFLAPFGFIWILFLMIYMVLPNTKIPFKPAAIGAAFTSSVWVVFILLFNFYIKFFAKGTLAIYGALAAFPLFLLLIYASTLIILYGAELSYILMHPHLYLDLKNGSKISEKIKIYVYNGISILYQIYKQFEDGKGAVSYNDLLNMNSNIENELEAYLILFKKEGLILETEEDFYIPTNSSKNIILSDLFDVIQNTSLAIPGVSQNDVLKKYLQDIFTKIKNSQNEYLGSISLNDVIKNAV